MRVPVSYRVALVLQEFDGIPGGKAVLRVTWAVSKEEDPSVIREKAPAPLDEVVGLLGTIREGWAGIRAQAATQPA